MCYIITKIMRKKLNILTYKKHHKIAKGCHEYISSVVEMSNCSYQKTFKSLVRNSVLPEFEFLSLVRI